MRLFFVRHGESEANLLHEFSNRGVKHGLTSLGREQARALASSLQGEPVARLFSSPLLRAVQTAQILSDELGVHCEITDALREYDCGVLEGSSDPAGWAVYQEVLTAWMLDEEWERRIEEGESFLDMKQRFVPFIEELVQEYQRSPKSIVLVGHGGLFRCMLPLVLVNIDLRFTLEHSLGNTHIVVTELGPHGLVCLRWGQIGIEP